MTKKIIIAVSAVVLALIMFTTGYFIGDYEQPKTEEQETYEMLYQAVDRLVSDDYDTEEKREYVIQTAVDGILITMENDAALYETIEQVLSGHYTQPDADDIIQGAIDGIVEELNDPHTSYFDLEEAVQYQDGFSEEYIGIGVSVRFEDGLIVIDSVNPSGPALEAGIMTNDVITHVDGQDITEFEFYEVINMVRGEVDTEVEIGVYRAGVPNTIYFPIIREVIDNPSVEVDTISSGDQLIGYIKVNQFGDETFINFSAAVINLENQGIDSLIIDLRDNGGGRLDTVKNMLNIFLLDDGNPMFSTEYYQANQKYVNEYFSDNKDRKEYNIVTLVNENSASASEVFASGMMEHGGYPVIGTSTYGKGTMQGTFYIHSTEGDALHLTFGVWKTADGNWVHYDGGTDGVTPSVVVEKEPIDLAYRVFLMNGETIEYDTVDSRTENIQVILNMMGYTVRTDGYFDTLTRDAIEDIQTTNALTVNGTINEETIEVINDALQTYLADYDTQLDACVEYILLHPGDPNE